MSQGNNFLAQMSPKNKRLLAIGSTVVIVGTIMGIGIHNASPERKERATTRPTVEAVITDQDPRALGLDALASQMRQLQASQTRLERAVTEKNSVEKQLQALQEQFQQLQTIQAGLEGKVESLGGTGGAAIPLIERPQDDSQALSAQGEGDSLLPPRSMPAPAAPPVAVTSEAAALADIYQNLPPPPPEDPKARTSQPTEAPQIRTIRGNEDKSDEEPVEEITITIPSGSIISGVLMTGMDAPTGNNAQRDPFPSLLRIKQEAILPNRFRADFRECFIVASGWGDLSSERAYMRAERISCVRENGAAFEAPIDAFATGEDGKVGIRGRLVSKQGQLIARSLLAGVAEGISNAFDVRKVPSINISRGEGNIQSPVYEQAINSHTAQAAGAQGVGTAMERVADYYLAMAENIFPVIEVDAMREVDFIVNRGMKVTLRSTDTLTQISVN